MKPPSRECTSDGRGLPVSMRAANPQPIPVPAPPVALCQIGGSPYLVGGAQLGASENHGFKGCVLIQFRGASGDELDDGSAGLV